jgi:acyl-CoA synthetase (AMP-forming)/AMP-acid ligase II
VSDPETKVRSLGTVAGAFELTRVRVPNAPFLQITAATAMGYGAGRAFSWTYEEAGSEVDDLANTYAAAGFGCGHRVGLLLGNRPEYFFHWFALNRLGVSVVPLSADWRAHELQYVIGHSEVCALVASTSHHEAVSAAAAGRSLMIVDRSLSNLGRAFDNAARTVRRAPDSNTECALIYTSGTTGRPKGCVLPNEYFLMAGSWYTEIGQHCTLEWGAERLITPLPMSHVNAMAFSTLAMVLTGGCIIPLDRFHPATWWDSVRESSATVLHYLGVMPAIWMAAPESKRDREHTVKFGFGAGIPPRLHAPCEARFGIPLLEAWSMTETGAGAVMIAAGTNRKVGTSCFGPATAWVDYRIVDEVGIDLPVDQPGELLVRTAGTQPRFGFFREYLKDPQATDDGWAGGYFHTGDIVRVDADGDFHFVDRKKNVIRRSGENISAVEVEDVLIQHPAVAAVGVTAVLDDLRGDEVMACIVPRAPLEQIEPAGLAQELFDRCLQMLAYYKAPGYIAFCTQLPLTPTAKIQRAELRSLAASHLAAGCVDLRSQKKRTSPVPS